MLHTVILTFRVWMNRNCIIGATIKMNRLITEQYLLVALFVMLYTVFLTFESVDEVWPLFKWMLSSSALWILFGDNWLRLYGNTPLGKSIIKKKQERKLAHNIKYSAKRTVCWIFYLPADAIMPKVFHTNCKLSTQQRIEVKTDVLIIVENGGDSEKVMWLIVLTASLH